MSVATPVTATRHWVRPASPTRSAAPRVMTSLLLAVFVAASLAPSLLPRTSTTQAVVTGVSAAAALLTTAMVRRVSSRLGVATTHPVARRCAATLAILAVVGVGIADARWQNTVRSSMNADAAGVGHWVEVLYGSVSICAALVVLGVGVGRGLQALGAVRSLILTAVTSALIALALAPMTWSTFDRMSASSNALMDTSLTIPLSPNTSGSAASLTTWDQLGKEGRKFVSGGENKGAVRTYVGLSAAPTVAQQAHLAVNEMARAGGFSKSHVVLAVPTGSGWVDENAASGIEERFDSDVATVAMQYSYLPSWATFLFSESAAVESADALLDAVSARIAQMPVEDRPEIHVYGQSLGSIGGSRAVESAQGAVCSVLWAGPPAGEVDAGSAVVLANSSDPVARWSTRLLYSPPDLSRARIDAPVPAWIPLVSYVQTTVDMVSALDAPSGHGHRYGTDQGTLLPEC